MLCPEGLLDALSGWPTGCSVRMAYWMLCPDGLLDALSGWPAGCSVRMAYWMLCPDGLLDALSGWPTGCSVRMACRQNKIPIDTRGIVGDLQTLYRIY
jgi:hypothetical protein